VIRECTLSEKVVLFQCVRILLTKTFPCENSMFINYFMNWKLRHNLLKFYDFYPSNDRLPSLSAHVFHKVFHRTFKIKTISVPANAPANAVACFL